MVGSPPSSLRGPRQFSPFPPGCDYPTPAFFAKHESCHFSRRLSLGRQGCQLTLAKALQIEDIKSPIFVVGPSGTQLWMMTLHSKFDRSFFVCVCLWRGMATLVLPHPLCVCVAVNDGSSLKDRHLQNFGTNAIFFPSCPKKIITLQESKSLKHYLQKKG